MLTRLIQRTKAVSEAKIEYEYEYRDAEYEYEGYPTAPTKAHAMLDRRELFHAALAAGGASLLPYSATPAAEGPVAEGPAPRPPGIIDTNISLFQWPFRRLPLDDTELLVAKLRALGISEAWVGSFEGLLHRDLAGVNQRLAGQCARYAELVAIGSINLELPGWEDDLDRCFDEHAMPGVRLHPNYHGYTLDDPRFPRLVRRAASAGRVVQIAVAMEDTRTQHPLVQVADVDLQPLPDVLRDCPGATIQILNARLRGPLLDKLARTPGVFFDTARVDGTDGIEQLLRAVPAGRVLFGTHAPFLIPEASLIRVCEANLGEEAFRSLTRTNAEQARKRHVQ